MPADLQDGPAVRLDMLGSILGMLHMIETVQIWNDLDRFEKIWTDRDTTGKDKMGYIITYIAYTQRYFEF